MISPRHIEDLYAFARAWFAEQEKPEDISELEQIVEAVARGLAGQLMDQGMALVDATRGYRGSRIPCRCGRKARFVNYRPRGIITQHGLVEVKRAYYHCRHCKTGQVPWDREQQVSDLAWSPRVKALVSDVAARLPYKEAVGVLERLAGLKVEESGAERIVAEVGGRLRAEDAEQMAGYDCAEIIPLVSRPPKRLYVSMDGTSAHIDGSWHEVKTGVVYEATPGRDGLDQACGQRYVAAQEPAAQFGQRLYVEAAQGGVEYAKEVVVVGDGAEWIWNLAAHHYPQAVEVLDCWHACEHIYDLARVYYAPPPTRSKQANAAADDAGGSTGYAAGKRTELTDQGKRWARDHCRWLMQRGPGTLLGALRRMKPKTEAQRAALTHERAYFARNRDRMQYARYRESGLMIGSGPVEAACKSVVGARLKRAGMRWSSPGADAILAIRTALLSDHHDRIDTAARAA